MCDCSNTKSMSSSVTSNSPSVDSLHKLGYKLDTDKYVDLLSKPISHTKSLQNCPPENVPTEQLALL